MIWGFVPVSSVSGGWIWCVFAPFPAEEILDYMAQSPIIQVLTEERVSKTGGKGVSRNCPYNKATMMRECRAESSDFHQNYRYVPSPILYLHTYLFDMKYI